MLFFILSKILGFLIKPHIWFFAAFLGGLFFLFRGKTDARSLPLARRLFIGAFLIFYITGNHVLVNELYIAWEPAPTKERLYLSDSLPRTAIVLGGYSHYDAVNDIFRINENGDRFMTGLQGLLLDKFDRVILTGGSSSVFNTVYYEAEESAKYMQQLGIDSQKLIIDNGSRNTYENAIICKRILDSLEIQEPVLLITSASHMYRSRKCYEKAGIKFYEYPVCHETTPLRNYNLEAWLLPSPGAMYRLQKLLHEWVGIFAYKVTGKI